MIGLHDIYRILDSQELSPRSETVPLGEAAGRLLNRTIYSTLDSPPFDKSAMDGWAICKGDEAGPWKVMETVAAGDVSDRASLQKGECAAIMTGAKIPEGTGKVIRVEYTRREGDTVFLETEEPLDNIIFQGENLKTGDAVLTPRRLNPGDIGILASLGLAEVDVAVLPRIGIITTGSEIREPGESLRDGEIYNSNGPQLMAQASSLNCPVRYYGITVDDRTSLYNIIKQGVEENDILLLSGGVSMGEFDFIPETLEKLGVEKSFHKAMIKPGRPVWFGRNESCFVFGLPGNPVSTYILFEVFVKYLVYRYCGLDYRPDVLRGVLGKGIKRRTFDRTEFLPVYFRDEKVYPVSYHGSSHLNAMGEADGLVIIDQGIQEVKEGAVVHVRLL
ncbi:MAG: molybdopterin molybdotransferase MoeA [Spirochaetales bacterium]|nr:molybdopterin molybdotransferase MoeA [Spirochaetales bacterium]